jgi:hypothetical protein
MSKNLSNDIVFVDLPHHGLGNKLWIWGKALCFARKSNLLDRVIIRGWTHINLDRYFFNTYDKRDYRNLFNTSATSPLPKAIQLRTKLYFKKLIPTAQKIHHFNELGSFTPLIDQHSFLAQQLKNIVNPDTLHAIKPINNSVAVHIRLGDFQPIDSSIKKLDWSIRNARTPIPWFKASILEMQKCYPEIEKFVLFTDGTKEEVSEILELDKVVWDESPDPLSSLICMSTASFLIGSRSSFSLFAKYFGQMPSLFFPGAIQIQEGIIFRNGKKAFLEKEWAPGTPFPDYPDRFWEENHSCFFPSSK